MGEQVRVHKNTEHVEDAPATGDGGAAQREAAKAKIAETDALLDDIERLLEEQDLATEAQASAFVGSFLQKGGE